MSIIVFAGPSIAKTHVLERLPHADVRPPAKQGDLYLATQDKPKLILLIDGFFESVPAVWHKEILYAMSIGIHVYGSSSMGALRAAELHTFGMVGVGKIFEHFANDEWEDDDEVALTHGPAELNYMPVSRAMADLRYDLKGAVEQNLLSQTQAHDITHKLKALWYPNRSHESLLSFAKSLLDESQLSALTFYLANHCSSLKTKDAECLLNKVADMNLAELPTKETHFALYENDAWQTLINDVSSSRLTKVKVDLPASLVTDNLTETDPFTAKLRARALEHAESMGIDSQEWIRPAFNKVATGWGCVDENGDIQFEQVSKKLLALSLTTKQFDAWIEREALLLAYADQVDIQTEHILDEQLIRQETN